MLRLLIRMATFVLVHGAWHGGWCWRDVAAALRADGHDVLAPTLSGVAERAQLAPHVDLSTHVGELAGCSRSRTSATPSWSATATRGS